MGFMDKYNEWLNDSYFDEDVKTDLKAIADNNGEIEDRFYKDLEFGTGGLRGVIGYGTNRMNIYTVRRASQGLANFIIEENATDKGVAIAYDSRNMSPEFALEAALCFCANGIKTYLFESLRPTPELSFAVRELGCTAGVVVTASHNPPEYNGYKVYWEDGAQITFPKDKQIIDRVNSINDFKTVKTMAKEEAERNGLLNIIGKEIDDKYIEALKSLVLNSDVIKKQAEELKIVYTPLHGTGYLPVKRILSEIGFKNVYIVKEQAEPDGNFPTVDYPNPEDKNTFTLALKLAKEVGADIVLATDPDADRLGVYAKDSKTGEYMSFTGNMSGMIICEYIMSQKKEKGILSDKGAIVTTVVSGNMASAIAKEYNVDLIETLTGFKYIGEQIKLFEETGSHEYLFGYEESYGCLVGTYSRDKDAVVAVMELCEAAAYYKDKGLTLWDQMINLYEKYGYYNEDLFTITLKGIDGAEKIKEIMASFRTSTPQQLGDFKVVNFRDYKENKIVNFENNTVTETGLPISDVLYFEMDNDAWCCVRPSGTEPKIKFYIGTKGNSIENAKELTNALKAAMSELIPE